MTPIVEKSKIIIIAAMSENHVIGNKNKLPWYLPEDLERFKELTTGHTVIMGRKTYENISNPLPDRYNIVLSNTLKSNAVKVCSSLDEALNVTSVTEDKIFVIGGEEVYSEALKYTDTMYLTIVSGHYSGDAFFPEFEEEDWLLVEMDQYAKFSFITLERVQNESSSE